MPGLEVLKEWIPYFANNGALAWVTYKILGEDVKRLVGAGMDRLVLPMQERAKTSLLRVQLEEERKRIALLTADAEGRSTHLEIREPERAPYVSESKDEIRETRTGVAPPGYLITEDDRLLRELANRASLRVLGQEVQRQTNLESVLALVVTEPPPPKLEGEPGTPSPTVMDHIIEGAAEATDEEQQRRWAKLLASEIVNPGRFSIRTVDLLRTLSPDEARLFQRACGFAFTAPNLFLCWDRDLFSKASGLPYAAVLTLEEAGLIRPDSTLRFEYHAGRQGSGAKLAILRHFDKYVAIKRISVGTNDFALQAHIFTKAGAELFALVPQRGDPAFSRELLAWPGVRLFDRPPTEAEIVSLLAAEVPPLNPSS